jgi:Predicted eukaryotic-type DNA primase
VDGRTLTLTNLGKVLYPDSGFTKAEVLDYYQRVAPALLPHIAGRPLTLKRYPEGVDGEAFFQKHVTAHRPDWIRTATVESDSSRARGTTVTYLVVDDLPALIWAANLAGLELHVPMWRMPHVREPDLLVFDLDPGAPANIVDCCRVAEALRRCWRRTACAAGQDLGGKGLQLYAAISGVTSDAGQQPGQGLRRTTRARAAPPRGVPDDQVAAHRQGAHRLEPEQRLQDHRRPLLAARPPVPHRLHPVTWAEVEACRQPQDLFFTAQDALSR